MEVILKCGDYALIDRNEYVIAYKYDESNGTWAQGRYFTPYPVTDENRLYQLSAALTEFFFLTGVITIHPMRFQEIAEKCVAYLAKECNDEEFLEEELDLTEEEKEYFGVEY